MTAWIRCVSIHFPILVALLVPQQSGERVHFGRTPSPHGERIITADAGPTPSQPTPSHATVDPIARQAGAGEGWWQAVTTQLAKEEYVVTSNPEGVGASNRAHNLRTSFKERGIELQPREGDASLAWRFGWETTRFGRPGALLAVEVARPEPDGFRVTYRRGELDEWYENSSAGLEQGFTVHASPAGEGPLCIAGRLSGQLQAELAPADDAIDLLDDHRARVLRYGELHVWDVAGHEVPARLSLDGEELAILVEDDGAAYPLTVDPLMTTPAWTAESDQASANFGFSVATAGDVNGDGFSDVIVGAELFDNGETNEGRAFVYHGSATGLAASPAWTAESNQAGAGFGRSVATAGDVNGDGFSDVIVGASLYDNGQNDEGRAFVYYGSATGLAANPAWTAESDQSNAFFGAVAPACDVNGDGFSDVIIGAPNYDNGQTDEGRAYVYHGSATGLAANPAWTAESNQTSAFFGAVAGAGDVNSDGFSDIIVGARFYANGESQEGRAFVYHGSATGLAASPAWTAESNQVGAQFGLAVATAGDVNGDGFSDVIVGAYLYDNGQTDEGRTFVYHGSATGLAATPAWTAESDQANAFFGARVATAGDVNGDGFADVIIGAPNYDNEGRAFAYQGSASGLATTAAWTAKSNQEVAGFGGSVATAGDVNGDGYSDVIVGANMYDNGQTDEGRAFVYHGSAASLASTAAWTAESDQVGAQLGISVATAGDVNGDGFSDVIVGAYGYSNGQGAEGRAFVYHGSASGLAATPAWTAESDLTSAVFGYSVATAGDVNGDGFSDVVVGAPLYTNGQNAEGGVFVYYGSATGLATTPAAILEIHQAEARFGFSVASAGDVNGDGYSDVIIGGHLYASGQDREGVAVVYHGSPTGLFPAWLVESNQANATFGYSVATAGDVNGDGFSDVIVGAASYTNGQMSEGRAFVYHGSAMGLANTAAWTAESDQANAEFGNCVATAGDVNGDGFSDVIVGAYRYTNGETNEGRASVYRGSATGLANTAAWTAESDQASANFAVSVATAGDVNGDGFSDVVIGAELFDNGETDEGRAFTFHGSATGLLTTSAWTVESNQDGARFGTSIAMAGDVNGDSFSDVIAGAPKYDNPEIDEGRAFVYYGNGGPCRRILPRQLRTDGTTPIVPLCRSDSDTEFRIRASLPSISGRTRLQIETEVKRLGSSFDGQSTVVGGFTVTDPNGSVPLNRLITDLTRGTLYHWRVRAKYDPVKTPFQRNGPWMQVPVNGWNEADLRTSASTTSIEMAAAARTPLLLEAARPNPFGRLTELGYTLPHRSRVRLAIYDVMGRECSVLVNGLQDAQPHVATWDGRDTSGKPLPAGVYFARLVFEGRVETRKIVLTP